jgi:DNA-directed RNA polymerase specialized sigma24 family protein
VIELHDIEQLGIEEVAARTGKSPGAVYMMRARAHGKLRKLMGATRKFFDSVG